jgi:glycosyltransferase involved in cell wall biosynthesis
MLQLYILTKDRPEKLRIALNSALSQDAKDVEIIVSDNSDSLKTSEMMHNDFSNVRYIKRNPSSSSLHEHYLVAIKEATADFLMLFHDDDILEKTHVSSLLIKLKQYPDVAAIASNGIFFDEQLLEKRRIMTIKDEVIIKDPLDLFDYYLGLHSSGSSSAPFPSYIYRTSAMKKLIKNYITKCGKHSDVQLLATLLEFGGILWLPTPTIFYRLHSGQDSADESIIDRNKLLHFMGINGTSLKSKSVIYFKLMYFSRWWKKRNMSILRLPKGVRERVVAKFLVCSFVYLLFGSQTFVKKSFKLKMIFSKNKINNKINFN